MTVPEIDDPVIGLMAGFVTGLRAKGFGWSQRDDTRSVYVWGARGCGHARWVESLEFDGWDLWWSDGQEARFETHPEARAWLDARIAEGERT